MGPLQGLSVVEIAGAGPAPFCAMVLADLGADVVRVDRAAKREVLGVTAAQLSCRGKRSIAVDLKSPEGVAIVLRLAAQADALIEGFRPGVAERLGIGPEDCWASNPRLVYARGTGYGQDGPLAARAGHDIDYVAVAGALHPIGRPGERPVPPLNLVADFGGGGMLLVVGVLAGIFEAARSGRGQVVDAAMVDGVALLTTVLHEMRSRGLWVDERGANLVDGGAPFYDTYETSDGRYVAVGAMEPEFFAELVSLLGLDADELPDQLDRGRWPLLRARFAQAIRQRTRDEWAELAADVDACLVPVLELGEAPTHPLHRQRETFIDVGGSLVPSPAPRFSRTPAARPRPAPERGADTDGVLRDAGYTSDEIAVLRGAGAIV